MIGRAALGGTLALVVALGAFAQAPSYQLFESGHVRPLSISPDGTRLFAVNTPDDRLEIFDVAPDGSLDHVDSVPVGMEPVAVAARTNDEIWVVNFLSDSVSIVDLSGPPRVVRTLLVGDEASDVVFAGPIDGSGFPSRAFVTTAHRGQNSPVPDGDFDQEGIGRADVYAFDATSLGDSLEGDRLAVITLFGDKPRALAVSPDGSEVYAAVFHSGNRTTTIHELAVCNTSPGNLTADLVEPGCSVLGASYPGGLPLPHRNGEGLVRPEVGLIVKQDRDGGSSGAWQDELGRDWSNGVRFDLPDQDVFVIDALATPPVEKTVNAPYAHVGTVLFNMITSPNGDKIYVSNTDSQNHVRFEGPGLLAAGVKPGGEPASVRGDLARSRITVLDRSDGSVTPRHLNSHITSLANGYATSPMPAVVETRSLATPLGMAISGSGDGDTIYVAAFGSSRIGVISVAELLAGTHDPDVAAAGYFDVAGGGPSGLVLQGNKLYVTTRFDNTVRVLDATTGAEEQALALHTPEPASVIAGRPFLYDATLTGSNGEASCSSCHIFADFDSLAWDLGDPDGLQTLNGNPISLITGLGPLPGVFHPMKGPMTTQSLRGLANMGPQHWRGDRQGDANSAFNAFNVAFGGLLGRDEGPFTATEMQQFTDFALQIRYPPNPVAPFDQVLAGDAAAGELLFDGPITDQVSDCQGCHARDPASGHFGGDGQTTFDNIFQHFKVPHLRNAYQKIGRFGLPELPGSGGSATHLGPQVRGFGFAHDGAIDTMQGFLRTAMFFSLAPAERRQLEAFMLAFPSDLAPIVGQQVTLTSSLLSGPDAADLNGRADLLLARADVDFTSQILGGTVKECDVIAKLVEAGAARGYVRQTDGTFLPDDGGPAIGEAALRGLAAAAGQELTLTCVPPGTGPRLGIDRDGDSLGDGVESDTRVFLGPLDTGTSPVLADTDGDGYGDGEEVTAGSDPTNAASVPGIPAPMSVPGFVTVFEAEGDLDPAALSGVSPAVDHLFVQEPGVTNGGFQIATDPANGIQLGLRASERVAPDALSADASGSYVARVGQADPLPGDLPQERPATWDVELHVDLGADLAPLAASGVVFAPGALSPSGLVDSVILEVDFDPGLGATSFVSLDVFAEAISNDGAVDPLLIQKATNLGLASWGGLGAPAFDPTLPGEYTVRLSALAGAVLQASVEIDVFVAPRPAPGTVVSFGVQGGFPSSETLGGSTVFPSEAVDLGTNQQVFGALPTFEDLDALHILPDGRVLFSPVTAVFVGNDVFDGGDIVQWDGSSFSLVFDSNLFSTSPPPQIDALTQLPNGNLLISTVLSGTLFGLDFQNGDVIELDLVAGTASIFQGLDEATLFTGANQDVDALHYDALQDRLILSVRVPSVGAIGGFPYAVADESHTDLIALDLNGGASGSLFLDGRGAFDGATRQIDALYLAPPPPPVPSLGIWGRWLLVLPLGLLGVRAMQRRAGVPRPPEGRTRPGGA